MHFPLHMQARTFEVAAALDRALNGPAGELAAAAFAIARVEYPALDPAPYVDRLDDMAARARARLGSGVVTTSESIAAFNEFLYDEEGFSGNRESYEDPRNSFLNEVLDRKTGIPITLSVVYLELARRTGLEITGVNFPGHFLLRANAAVAGDEIVIDPFHGGALLSEYDCRQLLRHHIGYEAEFDRSLLAPATRHDIVVRMLVNLKRLYVKMRSFPQARLVSTLLLAADPSAVHELRDRGLLAYHLEDFASALKDLEEYLRLSAGEPDRDNDDAAAEDEGEDDEDGGNETERPDETMRVLDHVKALRRRVAGFN